MGDLDMGEKSPSLNHLRSPNHHPSVSKKNRRILEGVFESKKKFLVGFMKLKDSPRGPQGSPKDDHLQGIKICF